MYNMMTVNCTECGWTGEVPEEDKAVLKHSGCPICSNTNLTITYKQSDVTMNREEIKEVGEDDADGADSITVEMMKANIKKYGEKEMVKAFINLRDGKYKRTIKKILGRAIHELENEKQGE